MPRARSELKSTPAEYALAHSFSRTCDPDLASIHHWTEDRRREGTVQGYTRSDCKRAAYPLSFAAPFFLVRKADSREGQRIRREWLRSEEHTSELQSQSNLVCR